MHVNEREVQFWLRAGDTAQADAELGPQIKQAQDSLGPYIEAGNFATFPDDGSPLPGFTTRLRTGHTPGHSTIFIESQGYKVAFWGDIVHGDYLQYDHPEIGFAADIDPENSAASRLTALSEAADERYLIAAAHHGFPGLGRVRRDETQFAWVPSPLES